MYTTLTSHFHGHYFVFSSNGGVFLFNNRKLRKDQNAAKILLHLCASLLCVLIVFVAGVERSGVSEDACRIVAALIHYFLLVAFLWMLIEAYFMYQAFVKVFRDYGDYVMWKCAAIGWGESCTRHRFSCCKQHFIMVFTTNIDWCEKNSGHLINQPKPFIRWRTEIFPRFLSATCICLEF